MSGQSPLGWRPGVLTLSDALLWSRQHERVLSEASESRSFAIPRQSVTVGGYLRAGETKTPRRGFRGANPVVGFMRMLNLRASGRKPPGSKRLARTEAALRAAENPMLNPA